LLFFSLCRLYFGFVSRRRKLLVPPVEFAAQELCNCK